MMEAEAGPPLLQLRDVELCYGGVRALDSLSLSLDGQALWGVMGANGAGKSSLFSVISGLQAPTAGTVWFQGQQITAWPAFRIAQLGMARTFQNIRLLSQLSVLDNLLYACAAAGHGLFFSSLFARASARRFEHRMSARAATLLGALDLWEDRHRPAVSLPYGLQRRLEIGRALMLKPKLLLLDEPAAGMNATEKRHLAMLLPRLLEGTSALLVEHDLSFLLSLCREILVLHQGKLLTRGAPELIRTDPLVQQHYLGVDVTSGQRSA